MTDRDEDEVGGLKGRLELGVEEVRRSAGLENE